MDVHIYRHSVDLHCVKRARGFFCRLLYYVEFQIIFSRTSALFALYYYYSSVPINFNSISSSLFHVLHGVLLLYTIL